MVHRGADGAHRCPPTAGWIDHRWTCPIGVPSRCCCGTNHARWRSPRQRSWVGAPIDPTALQSLEPARLVELVGGSVEFVGRGELDGSDLVGGRAVNDVDHVQSGPTMAPVEIELRRTGVGVPGVAKVALVPLCERCTGPASAVRRLPAPSSGGGTVCSTMRRSHPTRMHSGTPLNASWCFARRAMAD